MTVDVTLTQFKAAQRESWGRFAPMALFTTPAAASLVDWAGVKPGDTVLDVACGTGVVAVTAARLGARVKGLDLSPVLLETAARNAVIAKTAIDFTEGDAETLPYGDAEFDVVLSQFGHIFAPRPNVVTQEMLRVLKPGGRIAFSTWPEELMIARMFALAAAYLPPLPPGVSPPFAWGDPSTIRERLGAAVTQVEFHRDEIGFAALSPAHYRTYMEETSGLVIKVMEVLSADPARLGGFRAEFEALAAQYFQQNRVRQSFLMARAVKR
jgi:SAM-dependent methyltransferase